MAGLPSRFFKYISRSTLKRESAAFLMFWLLCLASIAFYLAPTYRDRMDLIEAFKWPVMFGFFGAFGLDWISKQTTIAGPPMSVDSSPPAMKMDDIEVEGVVSGTLKVDNTEPKLNG